MKILKRFATYYKTRGGRGFINLGISVQELEDQHPFGADKFSPSMAQEVAIIGVKKLQELADLAGVELEEVES